MDKLDEYIKLTNKTKEDIFKEIDQFKRKNKKIILFSALLIKFYKNNLNLYVNSTEINIVEKQFLDWKKKEIELKHANYIKIGPRNWRDFE